LAGLIDGEGALMITKCRGSGIRSIEPGFPSAILVRPYWKRFDDRMEGFSPSSLGERLDGRMRTS
jgi:hypothetical protein